MKNIIRYITIGCLCTIYLYLCGLFLFVYCPHQRKYPTEKIHHIKKEAQTGDIIFTEGDSFKSDIVRFASSSKSNVSHTGFLQMKENGLYVVHMSIDKNCIVSEPIDSFISYNNVADFYVMRLRNEFDKEKLVQVLDSMLSYRIKFDHHYDMLDNERYYCTELIYKTLLFIDCHDLEDVTYEKILYPIELMKSPKLKAIHIQK